MATLIESPTTIQATGTPPKKIEEFVGLVNSKTQAVSIARMRSPSGWRQALHAYRLSFRHPADGRLFRFEAPLPTDLAGLLARLRSSRT